MTGVAFVLSVVPETYEAENGKSYPYSTVQLIFQDATGGMGAPITCTGVEDMSFEGMGTYNVDVEFRMRNNRAGFRVMAMELIKAF